MSAIISDRGDHECTKRLLINYVVECEESTNLIAALNQKLIF